MGVQKLGWSPFGPSLSYRLSSVRQSDYYVRPSPAALRYNPSFPNQSRAMVMYGPTPHESSSFFASIFGVLPPHDAEGHVVHVSKETIVGSEEAARRAA